MAWRRWRLTMSRSRGMLVAAIIGAALIVILLVTQIVGALVAYRGIEAASRDTYTYVGDLMAERVASVVDAADDVVRGTAAEIERRGEATDLDYLVNALAARLEREDAVGSVFIGLPDGRVTGLAREGDGYLLFRITDPSHSTDVARATIERTVYNADLEPVASALAPLAYDALDRPWYRLAQEHPDGQTVAWTDPYVSARTSELVVTPVVSAVVDGEVVAYVGADLDTDRLGALLDDIPIGEDARAFVLTGDRRIVAAPNQYRDQMATALEITGDVPRAEMLGLPATAPQGVENRDGIVSLERDLEEAEGVDWVLRLEARNADLTPGLSRFATGAISITFVSVVLIAVAAAFALRIWRPVRTMRSRASTDALTGLANRYEFDRQGRVVVMRAEAAGVPAMVVAFDLDRFKALNDEHGHDAGDAALRAVGEALRQLVRDRDVAARLGGDEFAVALVLRHGVEPRELARRLRDGVEATVQASAPGADLVGVTAGLATSETAGYRLDALMAQADDALVAGKRAAKGRVYAAGEETAPSRAADSLPAD